MRFFLCLLLISTFGSQPAFSDSMTECESVIREGNEPMAYKSCLHAAKEGNPKAQVLVGMALMAGVGVLKDPDAAVNWFRRAADQKYPGACITWPWPPWPDWALPRTNQPAWH